MALRDRLLARIEDAGPIPFEAFMDACLYDPAGGFFAAGPVRSVRSGDFLTSPEVSPWFGRTLGRFASAELRRVAPASGSRPFVVADVGAGSGSLLDSLGGEVGEDVEIWAVEASPAARNVLSRRAEWNVVVDLDALPSPMTGVIVANELLDNLPAALAVRVAGGWEERWVGAEGSGLALVPHRPRPEVESWADRYGGDVNEGAVVEVQIAAGEWMRDALSTLDHGTVVVVDYGGTAEELEPRRAAGTLRTYRAHHLGPDPLLEPGETDVTMDVNFTALVAVVEALGASAEVHRQDDFLASWGLRDEVGRLRREELELARGGDAVARLRVRSEHNDAQTLMHPRGLGDFRVLVARKGAGPRGAVDGRSGGTG